MRREIILTIGFSVIVGVMLSVLIMNYQGTATAADRSSRGGMGGPMMGGPGGPGGRADIQFVANGNSVALFVYTQRDQTIWKGKIEGSGSDREVKWARYAKATLPGANQQRSEDNKSRRGNF